MPEHKRAILIVHALKRSPVAARASRLVSIALRIALAARV